MGIVMESTMEMLLVLNSIPNGDSAPIAAMVVLMLLAAAGIVVLLFGKNKFKK